MKIKGCVDEHLLRVWNNECAVVTNEMWSKDSFLRIEWWWFLAMEIIFFSFLTYQINLISKSLLCVNGSFSPNRTADIWLNGKIGVLKEIHPINENVAVYGWNLACAFINFDLNRSNRVPNYEFNGNMETSDCL